MPTIHVHIGKQRSVIYAPRTRDAGSLRSKYGDLEERMLLCLKYTLQQGLRTQDARTLDDKAGSEEGHPFYGNQHTGGISGPHVDKGTHTANVQIALANKQIKSAKMAVHALLTSGHPFSKEELAEAVGMDPKGKTINDYLTNLKNPKFAGPQGALKIEKNKEGHFFVALPNGKPAPPPDTKMNVSEMSDLTEFMHVPSDTKGEPDWDKATPAKGHNPTTQGAMQNLIAAKPAPFNAPHVPEPHAPEPSYDVKQHDLDLHLLKMAAPGTLTPAQADPHYKAHVDEAYTQMVKDLMDIGKGNDPSSAVMTYKQQKALAMAAWAQAVHGTPFNPKPQSMFKADYQLAQDVLDFGQAAALNNWKHNTAAEKAGNFPPKAAPAVAPAVKPVPKATTSVASGSAAIIDMGHPAYVPPIDYHTLRPKGHVDIDEDDIMSRKFTKGILKLKKDMNTDSENSSANKKSVETKLRERLADKPNFQALVKRLGLEKTGPGSLESKLIQAWAGSSGDTHDISVALQMAVRDAFDIPDSHIEKKALKSLDKHGHDLDKLVSAGIHAMANYGSTMKEHPLKPHEIGTAREALKEFVQAQYHETQEYLKAHGHTHVFVARGMKIATTHDNTTGPAAVKLQPASSFSANYATAKAFGGSSGTLFISKVPREQVLSTYMTGFGCTGEHEVVLLAHEKMKAYTLSVYAASSASAAQEALQVQFKAKHPSLKAAPKSADEPIETDY
jgi:hypothetical protein